MNQSVFALFVVFVAMMQKVATDVFTATATIESLLGAEKEVSDAIAQYIDIEMHRLERLKR